MIGGRRPLQGRKVADRRVRVERPHSAYFRYTGPGMMTAKAAASLAPAASGGRGRRSAASSSGGGSRTRRRPSSASPKKLALPIFSSDAISSSAYATEEILRVFVVAGAGALLVSIEMAFAIVGLLAVVSLSYRQVCRAYPSGGGAYVVARENIAHLAGLVAAAALLIDYVMTVAVSTAAAVAQVVFGRPGALRHPDRDRARRDRPHHDRQPARAARGGAPLRQPDLPVRGDDPADDRPRRRPDRLRPATGRAAAGR